MADPVACFQPNPAILSFGMRISFYCVGVLAAVTPVKLIFSQRHLREIAQGNQEVQPKREISSVVTIQGVNGLGLIITTVIQTVEGTLNLYYAYLVINLLFMMSTSFLYFLFSPNPVIRRHRLYLSALVLLAIFTLYVGLKARTFGSQPECNNTLKIIWFPHPITASFTWLRIFGIVIFAIYITVAVIHWVQLEFFKKRAFKMDLDSVPAKAFRWHGIVILVFNLVLIGIIEGTIRINNVPDPKSLSSFGETLSIVLLVGPLTDVWNDNDTLFDAMVLKCRVAHKSPGDTPLASYDSHSSHASESPRRDRRPSRSKYFTIDS